MLESLFKRMIVLNRILCLFVSLYDRYYLSTYKFTLFSLQPTYMIAKHLLAWNGWRVSYFSFTTWVKLCCFVFSFHLSPWEWVDNFLLFLHTHTHTSLFHLSFWKGEHLFFASYNYPFLWNGGTICIFLVISLSFEIAW